MAEHWGPYNIEFCYLPFVLEGAGEATEAYTKAKAVLRASDAWHEVHDDVRYLFRYICEKYDADSPNCQCHHFVLADEALDELGMGGNHPWVIGRFWERKKHRWCEDAGSSRIFIDQAHCYVFGTSVNILVLRMHMEVDDPLAVAERIFHIKNVRNGVLVPYDETRGTEAGVKSAPHAIPLLDMALNTVAAFTSEATPRFFFYANERRERANVFLQVDVDEAICGEIDVEQTMFYLANCYKQDFDYDSEHILPVSSYWATPATLWGYSSEALACLTLPARAGQGRGFLFSVFRRNIANEYQFLYLLLLHQKYAYYRLLMRIGAGQRRDREQLERFHRELEVFKANFVFSRVSETQQYQTLYEKVAEELRLSDMERDVAEPIAALAQLRQEEDDRAEREGEQRVERAMNTVALLAGISAICEALDVFNYYVGVVLPDGLRIVISCAVSLGLVAVTAKAARDLQG